MIGQVRLESRFKTGDSPPVDHLRRLRAAVLFDKILEAFEFVSFGPAEEHHAYLCLETGKIYWHSELGDDEEELPEDIDDAERYLVIPHKNDLNLGKNLAIDFVEEVLPDATSEVERMFFAPWRVCQLQESSRAPRIAAAMVRIRDRG